MVIVATRLPQFKFSPSHLLWYEPQHVLRPNKQYWNNCPRKLKFIFLIENSDPTFIIETRTKSISITPWPSHYNWITNQRYKVWMSQGRIPDKFTVLGKPKEEQSLTLSDFYSINYFKTFTNLGAYLRAP